MARRGGQVHPGECVAVGRDRESTRGEHRVRTPPTKQRAHLWKAEATRPVADLPDRGPRQQSRDLGGHERRSDRSGAAAGHDHHLRLDRSLGQGPQHGAYVVVARVVDRDVSGGGTRWCRVRDTARAQMEVAGAVGHEDHRVATERVGRARPIEDAVPPFKMIGRVYLPTEPDSSIGMARLMGPARAAALEVDEHAVWVAFTYPELERRVEAAPGLARRSDDLPFRFASLLRCDRGRDRQHAQTEGPTA